MKSFAFVDVPGGFESETLTLRFEKNYPEMKHFNIRNDILSIFLLDISHVREFNEDYDDAIKRGAKSCIIDEYEYINISETAMNHLEVLNETVREFNDWLLANDVYFLDDYFKFNKHINIVLAPGCEFQERKAKFGFNEFDPENPYWWIRILFHVPDRSHYFLQDALMFHEMGHFLYQSLIAEVLEETVKYRNFFAPLNEGFSDFVSYVFTDNPIVGEKYNYETEELEPFRTALSSTKYDLERTLNGEWNYSGDSHITGQSFRDLLILISKQYDLSKSFDIMYEILSYMFEKYYNKIFSDEPPGIDNRMLNHSVSEILSNIDIDLSSYQ